MYDDLQAVVDELAETLQRSVALDDPSIRLLAASKHFGDEDEIRVAAVLNKTVSPILTQGFLDHGIASWTKPGHLPLEGGRDRFCVPVRCNGLLMGYLWLIEDEQAPLDDPDVHEATRAADRAGIILYRRLLLHERSRTRQESILRDMVSSDPALRDQAVVDLRAEQLLPDELVSYQVFGVQRETTGRENPAHDVAMEAALEEGRRALPDDGTLIVANRSRAWMLLATRTPLPANNVNSVAQRIVRRYRSLAGPGSRLVVGIGNAVDSLDDVVISQRHAFHACRAALLSPKLGDTARWGRLGVVGLLLSLPPQDLRRHAELQDLSSLRSSDSHDILLQTLRTFLDNAGDIRRSADELCVHRATLYNRLKRVEQLTGLSLDDGEDRLLLHLAIKLADLDDAVQAHSGLGT